MKRFLPKSLKSIFLASALFFTGTTTAMADMAEPRFESLQLGPLFSNLGSRSCSSDDKPLYEMSFGELLEEEDGDYEKAWDIYELYQLRRITLDTNVSSASVDRLITEIEILNSLDSTKPITFTINSGGGSVYAGLRLYNAMKSSKSPIHTKVDGMAASMAAILLIAGDVREATPESRIMIHQVSGGTFGQTNDMEQSLNHVNTLQDDLYEIVSKNSGLSMEDVRRIANSDVFYDANEALRLGFIDTLTEGKPQRDVTPGSRTVPENLYPENRVRQYYKNQGHTPS